MNQLFDVLLTKNIQINRLVSTKRGSREILFMKDIHRYYKEIFPIEIQSIGWVKKNFNQHNVSRGGF